MVSIRLVEQDKHHEHVAPGESVSLVWLAFSAIGSALAALIVAGIVAGRLGVAIHAPMLLGAAAAAVLPNLAGLVRGRWEVRGAELALATMACVLVAAIGLLLAWPSLLPLGRSVDAVHQYQLVNWIATERSLPPLDAQTRGLMGEMIAYPPGFALVVNALAAVVHVPALEAMYPTVAILGGLCAGLVALLGARTTRASGAAVLVSGLAGTLLLVAHRAYFLEAYIDHSYYAMVLGIALVLLACAWPICSPRLSLFGALQVGLVLAALLASYPLWVPVPAACIGLVLVLRSGEAAPPDTELPTLTRRLWFVIGRVLLVVLPVVALGLLDLPARLATGQIVLEHQGVVTMPSAVSLTPLFLALPACLFLARRPKHVPPLVLALGIALAAMGALALGAQFGLTAPYHSIKMLFVIVPLSAALVGAALADVATLHSRVLRVGMYAAAVVVLALTSARLVLPIRAEQIPSADLVAASRWLLVNDPSGANKAIAVGGQAGPLGYWLQVALLGQPRDHAEAATRAFTITPPTPQGWAMDRNMPDIAFTSDVAEAPPGSEIAARFGHVAVLRRAPFDPQIVNPMILRYDTRWEEERLKTAIELIRPVAGPLPLVELLLLHDAKLINRFVLQPNPERTKTQYLGADVIPATLGGLGYINSQAYPTFAAPAQVPSGSFMLVLRLVQNGHPVDERLLATFDRTESGGFANMALHSGEFDYLRRDSPGDTLKLLDTRFGETVLLTGWNAGTPQNNAIPVELRWHAITTISQSLSTEVRLLDEAGKVAVSSRGVPQNGFYPTWRWRAGEDVIERRVVQLPPELPAGHYTLVAGVYDEAAQAELPLKAGSATLGEVTVIR